MAVEDAQRSVYTRRAGELGAGLGQLVHRGCNLLPGIRIDVEAGSICKQALVPLTAALGKEVSVGIDTVLE
jgi:hypothetical protein